MSSDNSYHRHSWRWDKRKRAYVCECKDSDRPVRGQTFLAWLEYILRSED